MAIPHLEYTNVEQGLAVWMDDGPEYPTMFEMEINDWLDP